MAGAESGLRLHVLDAVEYLSESQEPVDLIVCMGDTLVHFESRAYLTRFLQLARAVARVWDHGYYHPGL